MPDTRYVILSHGRAGTNYLTQNFRQHPEIASYNEPFHDAPAKRAEVNGRTWKTQESASKFAFETMYDNPDPAIKATGFKLFFFQCRQNSAAADIWDTVLNDTSIRAIFVNRRNFLNRYLSELRAKTSGVWHPKSGDYKQKQYSDIVELEINIPKMMQNMSRLYSSYNIVRGQFANHPVLEFFYEDLGIESEAKVNQAFEFLGVDQIGQQSEFRTGTLSRETTKLVNEDEVREVLENSFFREYVGTCPLLTDRDVSPLVPSSSRQSTLVPANP